MKRPTGRKLDRSQEKGLTRPQSSLIISENGCGRLFRELNERDDGKEEERLGRFVL